MINKTDFRQTQSERPTILVVDDLKLNREIIKSILSSDYDIAEAADGAEALDMIKKNGNRYDLIISDNHMESMDGLELVKTLSENPWLKRIPVIMTSSDREDAFVAEAYSYGVADFIFVPFMPEVVRRRVKYTIENELKHRAELVDSVYIAGEFYFVMMQLDLQKDTCEILETSEAKDMWNKQISSQASVTIRHFTEHGYIHPEDLEEFLSFTDPHKLKEQFQSGAVKTHFRYRRNYRGQYRWALMEIFRAPNYSPENQIVLMASRDIQEEVNSQNKAIDMVASHAISTDYLNITRGYFSHDARASYIDPALKEFDTISQLVDWAAQKIPDKATKERFQSIFSQQAMLEAFESGHTMISCEYASRAEHTGLLMLRTSVQMFRNTHTKDVEGIYYVEDINTEFIHRHIADALYYQEYVFIGIWDTAYDEMFIHKTSPGLFSEDTSRCIPYQHLVEHRIARQNHTPEIYRDLTSLEHILPRLDAQGSYSLPLETVTNDGRPCTLEYIYRYFIKENKILSLMVRDVTKETERDTITSGMNRKGFVREAEWYLTKHNKTDYAILYFNIKEFKAINELLGFTSGNELLSFVCNHLQQSALKPVFTARIMADQFVCLVERSRISEEILSELCRIELLDQTTPIVLRMHCGICPLEEDDTSVQSVCDKAKIALSRIENEYLLPYVWFRKDMNSQYLNQLQVINHLDSALENNEVCVFYQPVFDAKTKKLASAEALVRWKQSDNTFISPALFVPVLEEKGMISRVDHYVAAEVYRFLSHRRQRQLPVVPVSVNLSRMDFYNTKMLHELLQILENAPDANQNFRFEITESSFVNINHLSADVLKRMRKGGFQILIDDFGTGVSSLSSVAEQDFDLLKIDMSFVRAIGKSVKAEAVLGTIIDMSHRMDAKVVAEGVETQEQYEFLRDKDCDYIRGYYFSKPLPEEEFRAFLDQQKPQ